MRGVATEKRNVLVLLLMVGALAVLAALADRQADVRIMPPEPPEIAAKRLSPNNAFFSLRSARDRLLKAWATMSSRSDGIEVLRRSQRSLARTVRQWMLRDDAQLDEFLAMSGPAVSMARRALGKPYYLCPEIGPTWSKTAVTVDFRLLAYVFAALALEAADEGRDAEALAYLLDGVRIGRMVASDGPVASCHAGRDIQVAALRRLPVVAERATSDEALRDALEQLTALTAEPVPVAPNLTFCWRMLDRMLGSPTRGYFQRAGQRRRAGNYVWEYLSGWNVKRGQWGLMKHGDHLLAMSALPYPQYRAWEAHRPEVTGLRHPYLDVLSELDGAVHARAAAQAWSRGGRVVLALELFRRSEGSYPEDLDLLPSPIPFDPFTDREFLYRVVGEDYVLYSAGADGIDDDAARQEDDLVIHSPDDSPDEAPEPTPRRARPNRITGRTGYEKKKTAPR